MKASPHRRITKLCITQILIQCGYTKTTESALNTLATVTEHLLFKLCTDKTRMQTYSALFRDSTKHEGIEDPLFLLNAGSELCTPEAIEEAVTFLSACNDITKVMNTGSKSVLQGLNIIPRNVDYNGGVRPGARSVRHEKDDLENELVNELEDELANAMGVHGSDFEGVVEESGGREKRGTWFDEYVYSFVEENGGEEERDELKWKKSLSRIYSNENGKSINAIDNENKNKGNEGLHNYNVNTQNNSRENINREGCNELLENYIGMNGDNYNQRNLETNRENTQSFNRERESDNTNTEISKGNIENINCDEINNRNIKDDNKTFTEKYNCYNANNDRNIENKLKHEEKNKIFDIESIYDNKDTDRSNIDKLQSTIQHNKVNNENTSSFDSDSLIICVTNKDGWMNTDDYHLLLQAKTRRLKSLICYTGDLECDLLEEMKIFNIKEVDKKPKGKN